MTWSPRVFRRLLCLGRPCRRSRRDWLRAARSNAFACARVARQCAPAYGRAPAARPGATYLRGKLKGDYIGVRLRNIFDKVAYGMALKMQPRYDHYPQFELAQDYALKVQWDGRAVGCSEGFGPDSEFGFRFLLPFFGLPPVPTINRIPDPIPAQPQSQYNK